MRGVIAKFSFVCHSTTGKKKSFQSDELNVEKEDQVAAEADSNLI